MLLVRGSMSSLDFPNPKLRIMNDMEFCAVDALIVCYIYGTRDEVKIIKRVISCLHNEGTPLCWRGFPNLAKLPKYFSLTS